MKEKRKNERHKKKSKKEKKSKHKKERRSESSSSSGSESDEWVEQLKEPIAKPIQTQPSSSRDDWMAITGMISTYSKEDIKAERKEKEKKHIDSYNPSTSVRELNPYWKEGGTGLPKPSDELRETKPFQRPQNDDNLYKSSRNQFDRSEKYDYRSKSYDDRISKPDGRSSRYRTPEMDTEKSKGFRKPSNDDDYYRKTDKRAKIEEHRTRETSNWKKREQSEPKQERSEERSQSIAAKVDMHESKSPHLEDSKFLSDEKMNKLAAKIVKAEIMGDTEQVKKLKSKLEEARQYRKDNPDAGKTVAAEDIMLISSSSRGDRPLAKRTEGDPRSKGGKRKAETHTGGERMKYFSNDDGHSLAEMFEQEKYGSGYDEEAQLAKIASKHTNPNDDLEDIFTEEISKTVNLAKEDERNKQRAIRKHVKMEKTLEGCEYCVGSKTMLKHLMVSCGGKVYLALPARKSLTKGHCIITTVQHATCVTALDEDVWEEIMDYRKALVKFFDSQDEDVVFFETAVRLNKHPHLVINCVPMPRDVGDTAAIYFKKALLECEAEWSMNKKVVDLKGKNIRRGVPKGLPYFWVDFGMEPGFAHVIEDQQLFPNNFAEEIIGGILDLEHHLWKKPQREHGDQLRKKVSEFVQLWKKFDTVSYSKV